MQPQRQKTAKALKEAFFVQVPAPDGTVAFHNATAFLGKKMPFEKPKATCAMRVTTESIAFSLLHLTKRSATNIVNEPIDMPRGPLAELTRKSTQVGEIGVGEVVVERKTEVDGQPSKEMHRLKIEIDENGVASLDMADIDADDVTFELPKSAVKLGIYLRSPAVDRVLAVSFIGHLGKPGDPTTITRAVAMVLFSLSQLVEFRVLSKIETVRVPPAPSKYAARTVTRSAAERAAVVVPVRLFSGDSVPQFLGEGEVGVEVDLENANPTTGRLLFNYTPSTELTEVFPQFRQIFDNSINYFVTQVLGSDEVAGITYDIILGGVDSGTVERLRTALQGVTSGLDFTPTQYRQKVAA